MRFISDLWSDGWMGRSVLLLLALAILMVPIGIWASIMEGRHCASLGGKIVTKTSVGVGPSLSPNGGVAVVPVSISFCISRDGRILY